MLTFDLNFDAVNRNGWNKWRPWEDWSIISSRYIGTWCPWASYEVEQSRDGKLHYAFSLGTILADIWSLPVIKCNSAQTFMNMVLRCHMSRIIYWLRYRASQLSEISFTCDFTVYPSTDLIVYLLLVSLVSVQNAWQSFVAYDACFRLCLNAWARNCMEAPEFLRDECMVLRSAFGYATTYTWINVLIDLELLCHILLLSTQLMSTF